MFGLVLLIPVVMYTASLYPVIARGVFQVALVALFVGMVLYLAWREWVDPGGSSLNFDLLGSRPLSSIGLSAYRLMFPQSTQLRESVEKPWLQTRVLAGSKNGMLSRACCSESARVTSPKISEQAC